MGKTQLHPIFITLDNIPSWQRNKKDAKVLLGYMPIIQSKNQVIRKSQDFQNLTRKIAQRCWSIILYPILKLEEMEFIVKGRQVTFTPSISVFIADMLEANAITCTYKSANCKMLCPNCTVSVKDLNNMNLSNEDIILRTSESMYSAIQMGEANDYSIHNQKNVFWDFL